MKIIGKNPDFYDYVSYMYNDETLTFDRTDSYMYTKDNLKELLKPIEHWGKIKIDKDYRDYNFLLLTIGATKWLIRVEILETIQDHGFTKVKDFKMDVLRSWKDYEHFNTDTPLMTLKRISFGWEVENLLAKNGWAWKHGLDHDKITEKADMLVSHINVNDFKTVPDWVQIQTSKDNSGKITDVPILRDSGLAGILDPIEVYNAIEEYFSLNKTLTERADAIGTTDKDKIVNHGFDVKQSFRGK